MNLECVDLKKNKKIKGDYSSISDVAIIIPKGFVVVEFDSLNEYKDYEQIEVDLCNKFIFQENAYFNGDECTRVHLYYKVPNDLIIKEGRKIVTVGGFLVNFITKGSKCTIKESGELINSNKELSVEVLDELPLLPDLCYPLYGLKNPKFIGKGYKDEKQVIPKIIEHLNNVNKKYKDLDMYKILKFINDVLFLEPFGITKLKELIKEETNFFNDDYVDELVTYTLDEVQEKEVEWLWYPYIPIGNVTLLTGDPGMGKSYLSLYIASKLSKGDNLPFSDNNLNKYKTPTCTLVINGEDSQYVLRKRISLLEGNYKYINIIDESIEQFRIDNLSKLEKTIKRLEIKLIVIDPLQQYLPLRANMDSASEVRNSLAPLSRMAEQYQCSFLLIMHKNKNTKLPSQYRVLGSIDFFAMSRSILSVDEEKGITYLTQTKNSFAPKAERICIEITDSGIEFKEDIIKEEKIEKYNEYKQIIAEALSDGKKVPSNEMNMLAMEKQIPTRMLNKIKKDLRVKCKQDNKKFYWYLE